MTNRKPVTSLSEFVKAVEEITWELQTNDEEWVDPWFRGVTNGSHELVPSFYRLENHVEEDAFRSDFKLKAIPYVDGKQATEWEWYFLMQHYGLPTRLLDWSEGSLIALHFALGATTTDENAAVWAMDPWKLNRKVGKKHEVIFTTDETAVRRYLGTPFDGPSIPRPPLAVQPSFNNTRIVAQRGMFTVHGSSRKGLDSYAQLRPHLKKIEIARRAVPAMREQLLRSGISESTLFPELPALCRELRDYWTWERPLPERPRKTPRGTKPRSKARL